MRIFKVITIAALIMMSSLVRAQTQGKGDSLRRVLDKAKSDKDRYEAFDRIIEYYVNKEDGKHNLDTADLLIKQGRRFNQQRNDIEFKELLDTYVAKIYCLRNPNADFESIFSPVIAECQKSGKLVYERFAWESLCAFAESSEKLLLLQLKCYQHLMSLAQRLKDGEGEMEWLRSIANVHFKQSKYDEAESELMQIIKAYKKTSPHVLLSTYDLLTAVYIARGDYDKALSYALKTEKTMEMSDDSVLVLTYYGRLAKIYNVLGKIPESLIWAKRFLNNVIITKQLSYLYDLSNFVVRCLIQEKKPQEALKFILDINAKYKPANLKDESSLQMNLGNCYYELKNYDLAEKSYLKMIQLCNEQTDISSQYKGTEYCAIGQFYLTTANYKKAKQYLLEALKNYREFGWIEYVKETHLSLFKADSALGDYRSAIEHLQESNRLKDSMFSVAKNKQIEALDIAYKTAEREKDLKLLRNKEKLGQVQLQHAQTTKNWIIAGSGLLLIIAGLLYRQSRLRRKNNEAITYKNGVITHKNLLLQNLVSEKEWLLKEVHHRVKNNLHSVISLLEAQAAYLESDALQAIENSQHRIYAMSLIHQKLYQSDDIKTVDMAHYIPELVQYLRDSFDTSRIHFNLNVDLIHLNASQAIPLGLIINEALTNSVKYAFPYDRLGEITISFTEEDGRYKLKLTDNGIGMNVKKPKEKKHSLGLELIKGLTKEIGGEITFNNTNGVEIVIVFGRDMLHTMNGYQDDYLESA